MPLFCLSIITITLWLLAGNSSFNTVISFLIICCFSALSLASTSEWKGYFLIFVLVGGLLVFIIYFASLTKWSESPYSIFWPLISIAFWGSESSPFTLTPSATCILENLTVEFWFSLGLLILICIIIGQLLFSENTLRSFL